MISNRRLSTPIHLHRSEFNRHGKNHPAGFENGLYYWLIPISIILLSSSSFLLLHNRMNFNWTKTFKVQENPKLDDGDKLILPSSALQELLDLSKDSDLSSPMTFAIRHPHYPQKILHGGVKEFSGDHDTVLIPSWMMSSLGLTAGDELQQQQQRIVVQWKVLPKGTWAKLRPLTDNYSEIMDYRAALESHLRQHYNTLTIGQTLTCRYGSQRYPFLVVDLKPGMAVGVNDTDLEVDLEPYQATMTATTANSNGDDSTLTATQSSTQQQRQPTHKVTLEQQIQDIPISRNEYRHWTLDTGKASQLYITLKVSSGDAGKRRMTNQAFTCPFVPLTNQPPHTLCIDLVVGYRRPAIDDYMWGDLSSDSERQLVIQPTGGKDGSIYVGIHGYTDCVVSWSSSSSSPIPSEDTPMQEDHTGKRQCGNCQTWVPERTLPLHENFCLRNNILCPWGCGKIFKKGDQDQQQHWHCDQCHITGDSLDAKRKHMDYHHTKRSCDHCAEHSELPSLPALAEHRRTICSERLINCRYCHVSTERGRTSMNRRTRCIMALYFFL